MRNGTARCIRMPDARSVRLGLATMVRGNAPFLRSAQKLLLDFNRGESVD